MRGLIKGEDKLGQTQPALEWSVIEMFNTEFLRTGELNLSFKCQISRKIKGGGLGQQYSRTPFLRPGALLSCGRPASDSQGWAGAVAQW